MRTLLILLMAMLGGTYIFGGRGTILGTFLAAWLLVIVSTGMIVANVLPAVQLNHMFKKWFEISRKTFNLFIDTTHCPNTHTLRQLRMQ